MLSTLCFPRTFGGVENHILYLSKELQRKGHHVEIMIPVINDAPKNDNNINEYCYEGINVCEMYLRGLPLSIKKVKERFSGSNRVEMFLAFAYKSSFQFVSRLIAREILYLSKQRNIDIIHQHDFSANILSTKIISRNYPVILTNHTGEFLYLSRNGWVKKLLKFALEHYSKIIGPSQELAEIPFHSDKGIYIPNGVDIDYFHPLSERERFLLREKLGYKKEDYLIFCPRRWAPTKGIIYLAKAIEKVCAELPNAKFLFAGSNYSEYPTYKEEVMLVLKDLKEKGITNFELLGNLNREQIRKYYQISDVVTIPSLMEATSLAALESMASGCPVLSTNVGGMPQIISEGINGFLITPGDYNELAFKIIEVGKISVPTAIRENARKFVVQNYDWAHIAEETLKVYKEALVK